jgi:hypothetical protein
MARISPRAEPKHEERIEAATLSERLDSVLEEVAAEDVPARLLKAANALDEALFRRRQQRNPN